MDLQAKIAAIHERIASMSEERLDELMPILRNPNFHLSVSEDDSALVAYRKSGATSGDYEELTEEESKAAFLRDIKKRNAAGALIDAMEDRHIELVYDLLEETGDGYVLSEEEWAQIERNAELAEKGLLEVRPTEEVIEELRIKLEKLRK